MTILKILKYPDPKLRMKATTVSSEEEARSYHKLIADMFETMYESGGIGLAATQIDVQKQIAVIDLDPNKEKEDNKPLVLINPTFKPIDQSRVECQEGCLSIPEICETITIRYDKIKVEARDAQWNLLDFECNGLLSVCIQHEIDHLNGKLFIDYLSDLKRQKINKNFKGK